MANDVFFDETIVNVVDTEKLILDIKTELQDANAVTEDEVVSLRYSKLFVVKDKEGKYLVLDDELCGLVANPLFEFDVYISHGDNIAIYPKYIVKYSPEEIPISGEKVSIREFMGSRFNYNSRIERNMYNFKKLIV